MQEDACHEENNKLKESYHPRYYERQQKRLEGSEQPNNAKPTNIL